MPHMTEKKYYEILEVEETASAEEIRHAFQKKARKLHPDVNKDPDAEVRFKEVSEAYAILSDPNKRSQYDAMRAGVRSNQPFADSPFSGVPDFGFGGFGSTWNLYGRQPAYRPQAGQDVRISLNLSSDAAKAGASKGVSYERYVPCEMCDGTGSQNKSDPIPCNICGGIGKMEIDLSQFMGLGFGFMQMTCPQCEGSGRIVQNPCRKCEGSGRHMRAEEMVVDIPAHSHDESVVTKNGYGNAGTNGAKAGDLQIQINIPEEKLSYEAARGFQIIGFILPFLLLGFYMQEFVIALVAVVIGVLVGSFFVIKDGCFAKSLEWWRNGVKVFSRGLMNGIFILLLLMLLISCSANSYRNITTHSIH